MTVVFVLCSFSEHFRTNLTKNITTLEGSWWMNPLICLVLILVSQSYTSRKSQVGHEVNRCPLLLISNKWC